MRSPRILAARLAVTAMGLGLLAAFASPAPASAACEVSGRVPSAAGSVDLLATPVWHLRSTDTVTVTAQTETPITEFTVNAFAAGFEVPIARGEAGGSTGVEAEFDAAALAGIGRVFLVSGSAAGSEDPCEGTLQLVIEDVNPIATVLGAGSVGLTAVGLAGIAFGVGNPASNLRRIVSLGSLAFAIAGASLLLQQLSTPGDPSVVAAQPSGFAASVPGLDGISLDPATIVQAATAALLIVLVMPFPAELFNRTLEENLDDIRAGLRRVPVLGRVAGRAPAAADRGPSDRARVLGVAVFLLVSGLLYGLLDPGFGLDVTSLVTFGGIVAALATVTWLSALPLRAVHRRLSGDRGRLNAALVTLVVAAACVLISRVVGFLPGYLYGLVLGYTFLSQLDPRQEARAISAGAWWMLGLALVSWLMLGAVRMPGVHDSVPAVVLESVLAAITVAGIEGVVFGMIPLRFLPGEAVFRASRLGWGILYALGVFGFVWILLNPAFGFAAAVEEPGVVTAIALFIGFGLASVLFWAFFRARSGRVPA